MGERFSDKERATLAGEQASREEIRPAERELLGKLREYPELRVKIEAMLAILENAGGDVEKAAAAERRVIEELRQMGSEVLPRWAQRQAQKKEAEYAAKPGVNRKPKKPLWVHATGKNRNSRADLYPRSAGAADTTVFRICGSGVPWVFSGLAAGPDGFGGG